LGRIRADDKGERNMLNAYETPKVRDLGGLHELTLSTISKNPGTGDVIVIGPDTINVPGSSVVTVS
jgi:hypothetical protein